MRKNITVISGHYGSGKSEVAVNLAVLKKVDLLIDLDILNPYFRSRETEKPLNKAQIEVVSSPLGNKPGSDLPYLSPRMYAPFYNNNLRAIYDLGGNNVGARVFRQFEAFNYDEVDHFSIINVYREETDSEEKIIKMLHDIELSSGLKINGLINNSNLLKETEEKHLLHGQNIILNVAKELDLDIVYTCVQKDVLIDENKIKGEVIKLKLFLRQDWL